MAVELNNSIFIHVGRTGGYWVRDVLHEAQLFKGVVMDFHSMPHELMHANLDTKPMFAFLRNPVSWLASIWVHHVNFSWGDADADLQSDTLEGFFENIIKKRPTYVRATYEPILDYCTFVGKNENLREDLKNVIAKYEQVDISETIDNTPNKNSTKDFLFSGPLKCSRVILDKLLEINKDVFERAGYETYPEKYVMTEGDIIEVPPVVELLSASYSGRYKEVSKTELANFGIEDEKVRDFITENRAGHTLFLPGNKIATSKHPAPNYFSKCVYHAIQTHATPEDKVLVIGDVGGYLCFLKKMGISDIRIADISRDQILRQLLQTEVGEGVEFSFLEEILLPRFKMEKYSLIVVSEVFNKIGYQHKLLDVLSKTLNPGGKLLLGAYCLDAFENLPLNLSLNGKANPLLCPQANIPNVNWFETNMQHVGLKQVEFITKLRRGFGAVAVGPDSSFPALDIPGQFSSELERESAIAWYSSVYEKN